MKQMRRLWQDLAAVFVLSLAALGWLGREIYLAAPPIPEVARAHLLTPTQRASVDALVEQESAPTPSTPDRVTLRWS